MVYVGTFFLLRTLFITHQYVTLDMDMEFLPVRPFVCLSVCLTVEYWYRVQTVPHIVKLFQHHIIVAF